MITKAKKQFPDALSSVAFETADYKELLKRDDVDAVYIVTPHTLHFEQAMDAIDAGKHVLVEKPMVCSVEHAKILLKRLETFDKVFALAYQRHAQGTYRYIRDQIASGAVGKPTAAAPEYFEIGGPVRMVRVGDASYIAVTGCSRRACTRQRGLLLIREGGEQLLARLDEGGFLHQYAYGPGMAGGAAAAGPVLESALQALGRVSDGNPYPRPAP